MNSYFKAIQRATSNGRFPELGDLYRIYHPTSVLTDSDYSLFTPRLPVAHSEPASTQQLPSNHAYF
ncbi:MAG: hypothetical protein KF908_15115 [Nitrosomonas sp.]|nr:hypothetical protein [Nitrosomonas sp.]MCW5608977.1 hypothetical protein [Nitrosomonas sp.]